MHRSICNNFCASGRDLTMARTKIVRTLSMTAAGLVALSIAMPASAATRHHRHSNSFVGVSYDHGDRGHGGTQALVSDGPGTGFGFHRLPAPYAVAAAVHRDRQSAAVRSAVIDDALTHGSGPYGLGLPGDSVYGYGTGASYGVFAGADGYGSPYFAGWYGPGDGADLGPLGHAYAD